jgi:hypothetical protein
MRLARAGEQCGEGQKAFSNCTPSAARLSRCGVSMSTP